MDGKKIAWLDSCDMSSHIHRTLDGGETTVNVMQCSCCRKGPVDRYVNRFECRYCGAFGDLYTGIMTDLRYPLRSA